MRRVRDVPAWMALWLAWGTCLSPAQPANPVCEWNQQMLQAIRREATAPALASRSLAIFNATLHDGLESLHGGNEFVFTRHAVTTPVADATFVHFAAARMATVFYPSFGSLYRTLAGNALAEIPENELAAAQAFAEQVVKASLAARENDGSANTLTYIPRSEPGQWRRTPPKFRPPELSHWASLEPFVIGSAAAFRPPPPPSLDSGAYAAAVAEVREAGAAPGSAGARSAEQTHIAKYWSYFSYTATPAGHWNDILCGIFAQVQEPSLPRIARAYAILNLAMADAGIAAWDCKYHYEFWRPVHAIRLADQDGNPLTEPDPQWDSLLEAPPHPEYVSGHSTFSGAAAAVLAGIFGGDSFTFVSTNPLFPGEERVYTAFSDCAEECGMSRIYGGIHFGFSNREGLRLGRRVGEFVLDNVFKRS